jgi:hypothetical protein
MRRREFIAGLGSAVLLPDICAQSQRSSFALPWTPELPEASRRLLGPSSSCLDRRHQEIVALMPGRSSMAAPALALRLSRHAARTNEPPTEASGFSIGGYHRGFWASKELSGVRAAMTNLCSRFVDPSNQSQTTQSPSTAVTVITGPPELRRTVSPGLKGIFDSPAAS